MSESKVDSGRVVFAAAIILAAISVVMYFVVFLTLVVYRMLNDAGRTFSIVALVISAIVMLLACYLALTNRNRALASPGMSGLGWVLVCGGLVIGMPALGLEAAFPGHGSSGVWAALFLIISGAAVLQAERNARQATPDESSLPN